MKVQWQVTWQKTPSTRRREILLPCSESSNGQTARPIRSETRATLVASIARGDAGLMKLSLIHQQMQKQSQREKAAAYGRSI